MTTFFRKSLLVLPFMLVQAAALLAQSYADGLAAVQLKEWDKAIGVFSALAQADAADQNARLSLGTAYMAKGQKEQALSAFKAAFDAKPEGALAHVATGRILLLDNKAADAEKSFEKATRTARKDMNAWRHVGESYWFYIAPGDNRPNLTRAEQYLKGGLDVNSKDFQTLMSLGFTYKEIGNGGASATYYEQASLVEPKNPLPLLMLGRVYRIAKQFDRAIDYFDKAIALNPRYTAALRSKAEYLFISRKWERATQAYKDLVNNGDAVTIEDEMQLANCLFITKDCKGCSDLVEKILKKDGSKNYLRRLQAYCDYENGEYQRGLDILNSYFQNVTPDKILPSDYEYLGKLQLKTKSDSTVALQNLAKSIEVDSARARWALYEEISNIQYVRKDYCASAASMQMYLDSVPSPTATNFYNLGLRNYFCGDSISYVKALAAFTRVTEINANAPIGWLWRAKSAAKFDPTPEQIEANPDLAAEYGKATESWENYTQRAEADKEKNKKDLLAAYGYLSYVYFVKKDAEKFNAVTAKWTALDPANTTIKEMQDAFGKDVPADPKMPNGGSDGNKKN
ncbi:MAG: tetratricopeptide repeat protein [Saprospiraceae bacterium]|nr:tetratricopeptide repeat protein [Saprospiraceae bacterium]